FGMRYSGVATSSLAEAADGPLQEVLAFARELFRRRGPRRPPRLGLSFHPRLLRAVNGEQGRRRTDRLAPRAPDGPPSPAQVPVRRHLLDDLDVPEFREVLPS